MGYAQKAACPGVRLEHRALVTPTSSGTHRASFTGVTFCVTLRCAGWANWECGVWREESGTAGKRPYMRLDADDDTLGLKGMW